MTIFKITRFDANLKYVGIEYFISFNLKSIDCALGIVLNQFATEFKMFCHSHAYGYLFFFSWGKKYNDHIITCFHECEK